ncbi:MAG: PD40 domain-containing protein [Candidatus Eisenbacteria sp.]|nr:PD40 domain-containing protein [Candidatus Eisenbacteria bacterium]
MEHGFTNLFRRPLGSWRALLAAVLLIAASAVSSAQAQYVAFGKNKVSYREFEWRVLRSANFELYYYPEEEELAYLALGSAEESYRHHRDCFVHEVPNPIPIILYSSHHDFQQTNITSGFIPEGVAGLTETIRGRVLVPFDGSFYRFYHTLRHELVHAFQLSIMEKTAREHFRRRMTPHPLWFTEGMAEHWSTRWDSDGDTVLRDLVISGKLPPIREFWRFYGTFIMYKLGQSLLDFVGQTYGEDKLRTFYTDGWQARRFEDLFPRILGVSEEELSSRWTHWLRQRYYPEVLSTQPLLLSARRVSEKGLQLKPTPVPVGVEGFENDYVFISPESGYSNICASSLDGPSQDTRILVKGQRNPEYLSFHYFRSRMDISDEGVLVFSSQSGAQDVLVVFDMVDRRVIRKWGFENLVGITSPQWDSSGCRICFSGLSRSGESDLYIFETANCELERLTWDRFYDADPAFHPNGKEIVFVSDRGDFGPDGALNLFLIDLETRELRELTCGCWDDLSPSWSPDGERVLCVSTRGGLRDLYTLDREGKQRRVTHSLEAIQDPRWLPSGRSVLASVYHEGRMQAVVIPLKAADSTEAGGVRAPAGTDAGILREPLVTDADSTELGMEGRAARDTGAQVWTESWSWESLADSVDACTGPYQSSFALDVAQGGVAVEPGFGTGEGLQVLLSDLMGDRLFFFQIANKTISTSNFLDNFSAGVTYMDVSRRLNRGVSLFHLAGTYYDEIGIPYFERRAGGSMLLSYPLSRFTRVENRLSLAYREKEKPTDDLHSYGMMASHYVSWIHDTSLWLPTGPIDGDRCHMTAGMTMNLNRPGLENMLLILDARRYLRLGHQACLALRGQARVSGGPDPQGFLLGGSHSLRGYPWRSLHGTRALLLNTEVRFPLIRGFLLVPAAVGPLSFPGIQGAVFFDVGQAWDGDWPRDWFGSYGIGFRMGLGGMLVLRLDLARRTDFNYWPSKRRTEFYIGWNY